MPKTKIIETKSIESTTSKQLQDASFCQGQVEHYFTPSCEAEIAWVLDFARKNNTPITTIGTATGLTGGSVAQTGIALDLSQMNQCLDISWDAQLQVGTCTVQPGITLQTLEELLTKEQLLYPPNPGEKRASIGGTVATNASGSRSFRYGPTRSFVQRLRILLANGECLDIKRGECKLKDNIFIIETSQGECTIPIDPIARQHHKDTAGYQLHEGMDFIDLFIGSEGTLGIITEIELRLLKAPDDLVSGLMFFAEESTCLKVAHQLKTNHDPQLDPRVLEFFDNHSLRLMAQQQKISERAVAALYVEQECYFGNVSEVTDLWKRFALEHCLAASFGTAKVDHEKFREFRYSLPALVNQVVQKNGFRKIGTDFAVPDSAAQSMFDTYKSILEPCGISYVLFGHIGDNHLHANLMATNQAEWDKSLELYKTLAEEAIALGGTVAAEHGIGKVRIPYLLQMVGELGLQKMAAVKQALDPQTLLNPGNIIPETYLT